MTEVRTETVSLAVPQAPPMNAFVAGPPGPGPHPGLILCQEAYGVNAHIRDVAARFAREGFVTIAPELFHRTAPGFEGRYDNFEEARPHLGALTTPALEADLRATYGWLTGNAAVVRGRIHAVGFCVGGRVAFLANLVLPVASSASFYGGGMVPEYVSRVGDTHGPALFFWGGLDTHIGTDAPRALSDALKAAGKTYLHVEIADANHGFFCDQRAAYNPLAAREAWALTLAFFQR